MRKLFVTHTRSGRTIKKEFSSLREAIRFAIRTEQLGESSVHDVSCDVDEFVVNRNVVLTAKQLTKIESDLWRVKRTLS